jgi:hypothetical protein
MNKAESERIQAVARLKKGEDPQAICAAYGKSLRWLYKWRTRSESRDERWFEERSRRPTRMPRKTDLVTERLVFDVREELEREAMFHGAQSIVWELKERGLDAPSVATVNRLLRAHGVFDRELRRRPSKGKRYPAPEAVYPNQVHQSDFIGPRYLRGGTRFYVLNTNDLVTARAASVPIATRGTEAVVGALWATWCRLGLPNLFQIDNDLVFWGSRRHPRAMGQVLRLCLMQGVEPLFIPPSEPWRNGTVEKFNDHWQQKVLGRQELNDFDQLVSAAHVFEAKHNSGWRYRKTGGLPPNEALRRAKSELRFPTAERPPELPLGRPAYGRYHLIRFVRSDRILDIFGERHRLPAVATYEYVKATIDLAAAQLSVRLDGAVIHESNYSV